MEFCSYNKRLIPKTYLQAKLNLLYLTNKKMPKVLALGIEVDNIYQ